MAKLQIEPDPEKVRSLTTAALRRKHKSFGEVIQVFTEARDAVLVELERRKRSTKRKTA